MKENTVYYNNEYLNDNSSRVPRHKFINIKDKLCLFASSRRETKIYYQLVWDPDSKYTAHPDQDFAKRVFIESIFIATEVNTDV